MTAEVAELDVTQYTVQYELLRSQVAGPAGTATQGDAPANQPRGVGLALLLNEGMPGWLKTVKTVLHAALPSQAAKCREFEPQEGPAQSSAASVWSSSVPRHEITGLLASLVLSTRLVAHYSSREGYR